MSENLPLINLKTGYWFTCQDCGTDNFIAPKPLPLAEAGFEGREEAYRHFNGLDPWAELPPNWDQFEIVSTPVIVVCDECGVKFRTLDERDERDEGDEGEGGDLDNEVMG